MKKITLTCAHAIVKYLIAQKILINGKKEPLFPGVFGIFGHGNVACLGQALEENQKELPTYRGLYKLVILFDFLQVLDPNTLHFHVQKFQRHRERVVLFCH